MHVLLALLVLAVAFLLCSAWQLMRTKHRSNPSAPKKLAIAAGAEGVPATADVRRVLQRISAGECMEVLARTKDLPLIDLRPAGQNAPLPVQAATILPLCVNRLEDVLRDLPENRSAVLYGASDLSIFMIITSMHICGSAPLYVLCSEPAPKEAA